MIKEIYESDDLEVVFNCGAYSRGDYDVSEYVPSKRTIERCWGDIVDYCRSFNEGQTSNNS